MKRHELLSKIDEGLRGLPQERTVELHGHKFTLRLLDRGEETEMKALIPDTVSLAQAVADNSAPTMAIALRAIDGTPADVLFGDIPDDYDDEMRALISRELVARKRMQWHNCLKWLQDKPGVFVQYLWAEYLDLKNEAREVMTKLTDPLSKTPLNSQSVHM
jgi:hypothetical protein